MEEAEVKIREMVVWLLREESDKVVREIVEYWDREGGGCFVEFVRLNFPLYWIRKVGRN